MVRCARTLPGESVALLRYIWFRPTAIESCSCWRGKAFAPVNARHVCFRQSEIGVLKQAAKQIHASIPSVTAEPCFPYNFKVYTDESIRSVMAIGRGVRIPGDAPGAPRMVLDEVSALTNAGSLLSPSGEIVASYDLEVTNTPALGYRALGQSNDINNAALSPFSPDYAAASRVHVINGMGVTLGDSVIGITALMAIKAQFPHISFTIYRPAHTPAYVKRLYELAAPLLGSVIELPVNLDTLPYTELRIDLGNHLFWPKFASLPMIDFFLDAMGMKAGDVPSADKRNYWLQRLELPRPEGLKGDYVLLCPSASTPVRSIPTSLHRDLVEAVWQRYGLPIVGFGDIGHMFYTDVASRATDTADFLAWIKYAAYLVTPDTAAVHIAAGFDIPTTAFFTTIAPDLRVRDYPRCTPVTLPVPELEGIQASNQASDVERVERAYRALKIDAGFYGFT